VTITRLLATAVIFFHFPSSLCVETRKAVEGFSEEVSTNEVDTDKDDTLEEGV